MLLTHGQFLHCQKSVEKSRAHAARQAIQWLLGTLESKVLWLHVQVNVAGDDTLADDKILSCAMEWHHKGRLVVLTSDKMMQVCVYLDRYRYMYL